MKRVLFVDDEPAILSGIQRMLRGMRKEWAMSFVDSGAAGLASMAEEPFDVVVSDMRMPGMDGAEFLAQVKERHPQTIRIILSGHSEKESVMKSVGATHQYLSKPCEPEILKAVIARAVRLRSLLESDHLKRLAANLDTIPSLPTVYREVVDALQKPNASLEDIGKLIATDIGMSAKILQIVNSAYFGVMHPVNTVPRAVSFLGLETVNGLVLGVQIFAELELRDGTGFSSEVLMNHSTEVAAFTRVISGALGAAKQVRDDAFIAGMLHRVGDLILAANLTDRYAEATSLLEQGETRNEAFRKVFDATCGEIGAYVMGIWGLPDGIVEAIAYCEEPPECSSEDLTPLAILHVARAIAVELESGRGSKEVQVDAAYLEQLGLGSRLDELRRICSESTRASA